MTAGNGQDPKIDLRLSEQSQAELRKFLQTMEQVQRTAKLTDAAFKTISNSIVQNASTLQALKQDMKQFDMIAKSLERNAIFRNGPGTYFQGVDFKAGQRAASTARLGTGIGQQVALFKEQTRLAKEGLSFERQRKALMEAEKLILDGRVLRIKQIHDLERARQLLQALELRKGKEIAAGNTEQARKAERLLKITRERVALLDREKKAADQLAKAEQRRAETIQRNLRGDRELERSQAVASRRQTLERIRGDGGAGLFAIQANVMANYVAMNQARNAVVGAATFAADLDESLRNLQAITVITDENLGRLKGTILDVSEETKFFATDIANAAVTLGQAGFSTDEIEKSVRAVALLATATGTDLSKSVDLATSILGVFNMEADQMSGVADTLTAAVNNSKLNIDKLTLGLQYAGNTAAQSGVSFEELTASLGAMANAGIRSGSTLGTGMRQIMIALQKPSGEFLETMNRLGIAMEDVDLRSNGLYGVMQNLKDGGFTAADAIRSFEVRAASAFNALSGNLSEVVKLERAFLNSSAAAKANETQMRALSNQGRRFTANLQAVASTGLEPMVYSLRDALSVGADWLQQLNEAPGAVRFLVTGVTSLAAAFVAARAAQLAWNLTSLVLNLKSVGTAFAGVTSLVGGFRVAMSLALGPVGLITTALAAGGIAWASYRAETEKAQEEVQQARTAFDNASGAVETMASQIEMVDGRIKELTDRTGLLTDNQDLLNLEAEKVREQFREMGIELGENVSSVDELVVALQSLRSELAKKYEIRIGATAESLELLRSANAARANTLRGSLRPGDNTLKRYRRTGRNREADFFDRASQPTNSLEDLHALRAEGDALLSAYNTVNDEEGLYALGIDKDILDRLREAKTIMESLIEIKSQDVSLERQLKDIENQRAVERNRQENTAIVQRAESFGLQARGRVLNSVEGASQPVKRFARAQAEVEQLQAEAKGLQAEIEGNEELLPEVRQSLIESIKNNLAQAEVELDKILEVAQDASETRSELRQQILTADAAKLGTAVSLEENPEQVDYLTAKRLANLNSQKQVRIDDLRVQSKGDTSSQAFLAGLAEIEAEAEEESRQIVEEGKSRIAAIIGIQLRENNLQLVELQRQLKDSGDAAERQGVRDEIAILFAEIAEKKIEQAQLTKAGAEDLETTIAEIESELEEGLRGISDENQEDAIAVAERNTQAAKDALDEVVRLGDAAKTHAENASWYKEVLELAGAWAGKLREQAALEAETDGVGQDSLADANAEISKLLAQLEKKNNTNTRRIDRAGRAGGNPYKKKRDYIDQLIDELEAKLDVADNYLSVGREVNTEYSDVLETALAKVNEINGQIDTLQARIAAGGGNAEDQERLNTLIDQQARLTTFIANEEMRVARIKLQQKDYQEGILLTTKAWVRQNLNLSQTLQDGITNSLTSAKSALTDFFTAWTDGTKSGKEAFKDMATGILRSIHRIFTEMLAVMILQKALGWLGSTIGGDFGSSLTEIAAGLREGGQVRNAAQGEYVQGNLNRDSRRYNLMPGEYVLRRSAVQAIGVDELDRLNAMGNTVAQTSGHQGAASQPSKPSPASRDMNIYLVDERSQAGSLGPRDILAIVNDDIARGGTTKKLIKTVQMGDM
ncbi:phage tail tape measure protein [Epibacterium sp. MM17-32]|uniref:phage tail tape measure protein n=1 Tax=Epibacterium sp. MM17-32 TaxID=2917734 RepID=UPI001EF580DE|nr:phage tail tape measure protein [Epibacterium sp. MM17-32]MCG7628989.1 phage tail tape measure protein [Epibacterium sp. MM17-32]